MLSTTVEVFPVPGLRQDRQSGLNKRIKMSLRPEDNEWDGSLWLF